MQDELRLHYSVVIPAGWELGKHRRKENISLNMLPTFTWKKIDYLDCHGRAGLTFSLSPLLFWFSCLLLTINWASPWRQSIRKEKTCDIRSLKGISHKKENFGLVWLGAIGDARSLKLQKLLDG